VSPDKDSGEVSDRTKIFDATAPNAVNTLVSNLITFLIPHNSQRAHIEVRQSILEQGIPADQTLRLEDENKKLWELLHDSNFYVAVAEEVEHWSLTTLREKLVKIGAKVVSHGRYVTFQLAELAVPRSLFKKT